MLEPNAEYFLQALRNRRPDRLPLYEHNIAPAFMERALGFAFPDPGNEPDAFMRAFCAFWRDMGYDIVSYEVCIVDAALPPPHALSGGMGPLQTAEAVSGYDWSGAVDRYWRKAEPLFAALARNIPEGMLAVGGVGNGVFEVAEDLVGLEYLPFLELDHPEAHAELYRRIGDLMYALWERFLDDHAGCYAACRFGDDLGFRSSLLTTPSVVRDHIIPQYRRLVGLIHSRGKPFIYHSCGCIFEVMDDILAVGVEAKHSNEDAIAPFERWIEEYNGRIALLGGIDMDYLCRATPEDIFATTLEKGAKYRGMAKGFALGSGNSIPDYVPVDNYMAMIRASNRLRDA